jgi:hypothetical protein
VTVSSPLKGRVAAGRWFALLRNVAAVAMASLFAAPAATFATPERLGMREARAAAGAAVVAHPSYRIIDTTHPLRTRTCWRVRGGSVRCSLYRVAPDPCALDGPSNTPCAMVLAARIWLVEVSPPRDHGKASASILRIKDTTSLP